VFIIHYGKSHLRHDWYVLSIQFRSHYVSIHLYVDRHFFFEILLHLSDQPLPYSFCQIYFTWLWVKHSHCYHHWALTQFWNCVVFLLLYLKQIRCFWVWLFYEDQSSSFAIWALPKFCISIKATYIISHSRKLTIFHLLVWNEVQQ